MAALKDLPVFYRLWDLRFAIEPDGEIPPSLLAQAGIGSAVNVTAATNTEPIQITTESAHGLATGKIALMAGIEGNLGANGIFPVTVLNATQFTLDFSTGTGEYTSGGTAQKIARGRAQSILLGIIVVQKAALGWNWPSTTGKELVEKGIRTRVRSF